MRDKIKKKLKEIGGDNLQINENSKSVRKKTKDSFISIVTQLRNVWEKSNNLQADHGVNLVQYEDQYYKIIECLIYELYGDKAAEIIMWWVYDVDNPNKEDYYIYDKENKNKYAIKSVSQLYTTLRKMKLLK